MGQQQFVTENGEPITQEQFQQILAAQQNQMGYEDGIGQKMTEERSSKRWAPVSSKRNLRLALHIIKPKKKEKKYTNIFKGWLNKTNRSLSK
jgi:hypothetical protein